METQHVYFEIFTSEGLRKQIYERTLVILRTRQGQKKNEMERTPAIPKVCETELQMW